MIVLNGLREKAAPRRGHNDFGCSWTGSGFERLPVPSQLPVGWNEEAEIEDRRRGGDIGVRREINLELIWTEKAQCDDDIVPEVGRAGS